MVYIQIPEMEVGAYPSSQAIIESKSLKSMVVYRGTNVGYFVGEGAKGSLGQSLGSGGGWWHRFPARYRVGCLRWVRPGL